MTTIPSGLLTADELAARLRVSPETVRAWERCGAIPSLRFSAKIVRYDPETVRDAIAKRPAKGGGA